MASTQTSKESAIQVASAEAVDTKLEVIAIPVSDVDEAARDATLHIEGALAAQA
jgi:hypothetical protein